MNFLKKLFVKNPGDLLERGDRFLAGQHYYEARCAYEDARQLLQNRNRSQGEDALLADCEQRINNANRALAEMNITEAESCHARGMHDKAVEHLELAKSLTDEVALREKAEILLAAITRQAATPEAVSVESACSSCKSHEPEVSVKPDSSDIDMPLMEYFDLLIQQLPHEMQARYAGLGEEFAYFYVAASRNLHEESLELLEKWHDGSSNDIYSYEKGMILYRLGRVEEALSLLNESIRVNAVNSLAHLGRAMMLIDVHRLSDAAQQLDAMISDGMLAEQSRLLRADVYLLSGDTDGAIEAYSGLLSSPSSRTAAERLHEVLIHCGRTQDAKQVFKRFLSGCCH